MQRFTGIVVSNKMLNTAVVSVRRQYRHPLYGKSVTTSKKYSVHAPMPLHEGDEVAFVPCKPMSKTKKWKIVEIVKPNKIVALESAQVTKDDKKKTKKTTSKTSKAKKTRVTKSK